MSVTFLTNKDRDAINQNIGQLSDELARSAATHQPIIGDNGNWFLWDRETESYVDSGVCARGSGNNTENVIDGFETDETLKFSNGILSVNTAQSVEEDNTLPITSKAVYTEIGNINAILKTI